VDIFVSSKVAGELEAHLRAHAINYDINKMDVQSQLDELWKEVDSRPANRAVDVDNWNDLATIYEWLDTTLPSQCKAGVICETYTIGSSIEGRDIKAFKISKAGAGRRAYLIDATHHAREWLSTGTLIKIIDHLVNQYGVDADVTRLVDLYDWVLIPVVNPDGYQYTWDTERLWRKNRRAHGGAANCYGVDLNRNYNFRWGTDGVSHSECSEQFCGTGGNSEPETQAVAAEYATHAAAARALVTIHAYGYMWMWPWGNYEVDQPGQTCDLSDDHAEMQFVGDRGAVAIENTHGTEWASGNSCVVIYATTGGTDDYTKGVLNVKYTFCAEVRGNSFVVPPTEIDLSFTEMWNGIVETDAAITDAHGPAGP